ncbi:hypothetical protein F5878DRAFT_617644 [Lentinula raphanica]|uniref:Uncharacterized protein n=1 Tax=Lentinula raphanica TaxID=153919 RepID=A0AA38P9Z7_9AGAR|nr:hypothetical protein F5878DRAFT_617644 [Lentinula raphanica]
MHFWISETPQHPWPHFFMSNPRYRLVNITFTSSCPHSDLLQVVFIIFDSYPLHLVVPGDDTQPANHSLCYFLVPPCQPQRRPHFHSELTQLVFIILGTLTPCLVIPNYNRCPAPFHCAIQPLLPPLSSSPACIHIVWPFLPLDTSLPTCLHIFPYAKTSYLLCSLCLACTYPLGFPSPHLAFPRFTWIWHVPWARVCFSGPRQVKPSHDNFSSGVS